MSEAVHPHELGDAGPSQDQVELARLIAQTMHDPYRFVLGAFPWGITGTELEKSSGPRHWQREVLIEVGERLRAGYAPDAVLMPVLKAVSSGHGIGKSALVSWLIAWALCTCVDAKVVLTANTETQLRTKTLVEVAKWFRLLICAHWFKVQGMSIYATAPGHEKTWRCDAVTWSEDNLESFQGLHNKDRRIVLIFDEASGIPDPVWDVAEGALTDSDTEILWFAFGNPTQPATRFHACFGRQRDRWRGRHIDSRDVPGTNKALFAEWATAYGEDSDFFRVRVKGQFPRAGSMQWIGVELAEAAAEREVHTILTDAVVLGVDVARFGDDQSCIVIRKGRDARSMPPIKLRGVDTMQLAARVADEASRYHASAVFIDGGGVGGGVVDRCRQLCVRGVYDVQFGGKDDRVHLETDAARYANKRAGMWGAMKVWLETGAIPNDPELISDLAGPMYSFNVHNEIQLERKQDMKRRGLASPDLADALALTFAYPVAAHATAGGPWNTPRVQQDYDPWEYY